MMGYIQPEGRGTGLEPMSKDRHGIGDGTLAQIPDRGVLWGQDDFGRPESKVEFDQPPGGLNTLDVQFDRVAEADVLDTLRMENGKFMFANFFIPAGRLNNYANWSNDGFVDAHVRCKISAGTKGAGRDKDYSGDPVINTYTISWANTVTLYPPVLTAQTIGETLDLNDIAFLGDLDPDQDIPGYAGRDKIGFAVADGDTSEDAKVWYTVADTYRVIVLRSTADAAAACEIAYTDIILGGEAGTITWTTVDLGSTVNEAGEAMAWPYYNGLYMAAAGDIYRSTNQGVSNSLAYTGATVINQIAMDFDDNVWAVGATNTIVQEKSNNRGTFTAKVGPSGGGDFTAVEVARDGWLFAGNGSSIFRSNNLAKNTGGWTELKDFGTNHTVEAIQCIDGESQLVRVLVTDSTGNDGDIWYSLDGGNSFVMVTDLSNAGYNNWWVSEVDPNVAFIVGEDNSSVGVVHKLAN
jgi:hypothetical protein